MRSRRKEKSKDIFIGVKARLSLPPPPLPRRLCQKFPSRDCNTQTSSCGDFLFTVSVGRTRHGGALRSRRRGKRRAIDWEVEEGEEEDEGAEEVKRETWRGGKGDDRGKEEVVENEDEQEGGKNDFLKQSKK